MTADDTGVDTNATTAPIAQARIATGTKIGTEVFGVRVISGAVDRAEPGSIVLRQLYPGQPTDIGVIDSIAEGTGELTLYPAHRREWTDRDRAALAAFFAACYTDRYLACLNTAPADGTAPPNGAAPTGTSTPTNNTAMNKRTASITPGVRR
jgi:hypothetical protein